MLVHALITSRVDYCNSLLYGLPNYQLNKLQRVLNTSAELVCNAPRLPVKARIQFQILLITLTVTLGDRAFMVVAPTPWNSFPNELRAITNVKSFKAHIKTYLFRTVYW